MFVRKSSSWRTRRWIFVKVKCKTYANNDPRNDGIDVWWKKKKKTMKKKIVSLRDTGTQRDIRYVVSISDISHTHTHTSVRTIGFVVMLPAKRTSKCKSHIYATISIVISMNLVEFVFRASCRRYTRREQHKKSTIFLPTSLYLGSFALINLILVRIWSWDNIHNDALQRKRENMKQGINITQSRAYHTIAR